MYNILIVDDNESFDIQLYNYIKYNTNNINIVNIATNGKEALNFLSNNEIDIILLDLQMPKINGLELIETLQKSTNFNAIKIIVISSHMELVNEIYSRGMLVENIFLKPFNISDIIEYINTIDIQNNDNYIYIRIKKLLLKFAFNTNNIGYSYLVDCIFLSIKNPNLLEQLNKFLYLKVSKKYRIKPNTIKWNIEKLIRSMIRYTEKNIIYEYFQYTIKPSPKVFIKKWLRYYKTKMITEVFHFFHFYCKI